MDSGFIILQDTREKIPLHFPTDIPVHVAKLDTGDYSLVKAGKKLKVKYTDEDLNHLLCIDRKQCPSEIFTNFTQQRFKDCLHRMSHFRHKYLLMEFSYNQILQFPHGSSIPRRRWKYLKVKPKFIISCLMSMSISYGIQPIFAGDADNASYIATELIKKVYKSYMEQ